MPARQARKPRGIVHSYPAIQDIPKYVVDKGKSQVISKDKVGENLYNHAVLRHSKSPMPVGRRLGCRGLRHRSI